MSRKRFRRRDIMNELRLEKIAYAISQELSGSLIHDAQVEIQPVLAGNFAAVLRGNLFCKDAGRHVYTTPCTWWDHLKETYPRLQKLFGPPKTETTELIVRVVLDPSTANVPDNPVVVFPVFDESAWLAIDQDTPEYIEHNEMRFYPTIYKKAN